MRPGSRLRRAADRTKTMNTLDWTITARVGKETKVSATEMRPACPTHGIPMRIYKDARTQALWYICCRANCQKASRSFVVSRADKSIESKLLPGATGDAGSGRKAPINRESNRAALDRYHNRLKPPTSPRGSKEDDTQKQIMRELESRGYVVKSTSEHRKATVCSGCGTRTYSTESTGQSEGIGDLLVRNRNWPALLWLMLEVKGPTTNVSDEQFQEAILEGLVVVYCVEDALAAVRYLEEHITPIRSPQRSLHPLTQWGR